MRPKKTILWNKKLRLAFSDVDETIAEVYTSAELPEGYNIVLWDGEHHLHHGLLEYLQSRH